jgi:4-hydroxy-4-methyl-2-oxoglutarate aldolase
MKRKIMLFIYFFVFTTIICSFAQPGVFTKEELIQYTQKWEGERFPDGRPKVSDGLLERMKLVSLEEAWSVCRNAGYEYQFTQGLVPIKHDADPVVVGRALTVQYLPRRPDVREAMFEQGKKDGRIGDQVSWPIEMLVEKDVYVADVYALVDGGPIIGSNLATAIYARSQSGVIFDGYIRDLEGIETIEGFKGYVRGFHPSWSWGSMVTGINVPIRIGDAIVMPGDVVLAKREGVVFVPPHLAEKVCTTSELVRLRDQFGFLRLREGKYTPGQIDGRWEENIEKDFSQWLKDHMDELPVPKEQIQEILKQRTW